MALEGTLTYDNLIAGDFPITTDRQSAKSGEILSAGALLAKVTASGLLVQCKSGGVDGSQTPYAILVDDVDATGGNTVVDIYLTGAFNQAKIGLATGDDIADFKDALRALGIFCVHTQEA
jgi:hypothetical protein